MQSKIKIQPMADHKIIFSMSGVSKTFPPKKQVLKNIWLSFFYGAKIGVLGLNGSGKSSLLKLIAGLDKNYEGKIEFDGSFKIGYLEQEPQLDESKTVRQVVEEGVQDIVDLMGIWSHQPQASWADGQWRDDEDHRKARGVDG